MAEAIVIRVTLEPTDIAAAGQKIAKQLQSAIDSGLSGIKSAGGKVGDALSDGMAAAAAKAQATIATINRKGANDRLTIEKQHQAKIEQEALRSVGRLESIATKSAASIRDIEAKKQAQLDLLRERFAQREIERQRKLDRQAQQNTGALNFIRRFSSTVREAGESIQQAGFGLAALSGGIFELGRRAVQSAIQIDQQVNVLKALTGSAEAAEKRFASLVALSAKSPGLTTSLAATLDAQLRVAGASVQAIDKLLPVVGKLNAISPLQDSGKFTQNLVQLISQNFERTDLKELVGQSPLAGELIKTLFNVDSPTNSKAIRESAAKLGITTVDALANGLATAATNNPKLANVTESLGTQIEKLRDRVLIAFRPLGLSIITALTPLVEKIVPIIEKISKAFDNLSPSVKQTILIIGVVVAAFGPLLIALGSLIQTLGALGNIVTVVAALFGVGGAAGGVTLAAGLGATLTAALPVIAAIAALTAALALGFVAWNKYGASAEDANGNLQDTNRTLSETPGLLQGITNDLFIIDDAIKSVFGVGVLRSFDDVLKGTAADIAILKDLVELFNASFLSTIKTITLGLLGPLKSALGVVGIEISSLSGEVNRLSTEIQQSNQRFAEGFSNLRATERRIAVSESLGKLSAEDQARAGLFLGETFDVPSGPNFIKRNFQAEVEARGVANKGVRSPGTGGSGESKARALRDAQLRFTKETFEQQARLLEDANARELKLVEDRFADEQLTAREFYQTKTRLQRAAIDISIDQIKREMSATESALRQAKSNTPERVRLETELVKLRTDLTLKTLALTDVERENHRAFMANAQQKREELLKQTQSLGLSPVEGQLPTDLIARTANPFEEEARRKLATAQQATIDFRLKDLELQRQEVAIQNAVTTGQLNEAQAKEATLALQRQYGAELIRQLELQKQNAALTDEQLGQLNVQIEQLKTLGSELSPAEAFFKGLRSQAETTAEAFERIGQRFKESVLSPIDSGIDKLTEKLGIFKDVLGDILKLLARQVINKLFGGGGSFGGGQQGGGSFSLGGLVGAVTGGGGTSFGGASTGGFAGGNPVQQILGGGGGSGGGGISGLIQKIPVLGKLFGAGGKSLVGGIGPNIGSLPGGIQGVGSLPLTGPASAGGAGALGGLSGLLGPAAIAGGGILGSLAGGKNKFGQLLGGVGGSLLAGFGAAALNPALLPVLFSNPITAVIGGALIGGALLVNFLSGREQRRFRKEVENAYQVKVDGKEQGTALYKSIKSLGEEKFGKGKFGKNLVPTIQLEKAKDQIAAYGEATGQNNVPLVIEFRNRRGLQNADDPRNQFPRFAFGGFVPFPDLGRDSVLTALRGREYVTRPEIVAREGVGAFDALNAGQATIAPVQGKANGGFVQPSSVRISSTSGGETSGGWLGKALQRLDELLKANLEATIQQIEIGERIRGVSPGAVLVAGTKEPIAQNAIADAAGDAMEQGTSGGRRMLTATRRPR